MNTRPYSDELTHYGVKGMKWGVRRTPEQLGHKQKKKQTYSPAIPKNSLAKDLEGRRYNDPEKIKIQLRGGYLKPGDTLYRVTNSKNERPGRKYFSFTSDDANVYKYDTGMFPGKYQAVYKVKSPIKVAGVTQALDTYCSLNKKFANTKLSDLRYYKLNKSYYDRELSNFDMNMRVSDMSKILLKTAPKTAQSLVEMTVSSDPTKLDLVKDKRLEKRYINTLKKNGYDASIDIADSFGGWEDTTYPTITFNDDKIEFVENRDRW